MQYSGEADLRPASRGAECAKSRLRDDDLVHITKSGRSCPAKTLKTETAAALDAAVVAP